MRFFTKNRKMVDKEIYYPNMCHICRRFGENVNLKRCGSCEMISYCCEEHQIQDWPSHRQFCKVIRQIKREWGVSNVFQPLKDIAARTSTSGLAKNRKDLTSLAEISAYLSYFVKQLLNRDLKTVEDQMIKFPRVCAICYESTSQLLTNCKKCPLSSFCQQHLNDPSHESQCSKNLSSYDFKTKIINPDPILTLLDKIEDNKQHYVTFSDPQVRQLPTSMLQFVETHFLADLDKFGINNVTITEELTLLFNNVLSERYSRSLTLLFAIEKLGFNHFNSMVIHVVCPLTAEQFYSDWEIIFHFLPQLRRLRLILIGPVFLDCMESKQLCQVCENEGRKLTIETEKALYHEYCVREERYTKPDMLVCFNPGFYVFDYWEKSIEFFDKGQCPLLVGAVHITDALIGKNFIDSRFPSAKCIYNDYNPFASATYHKEMIYVPMNATNQFMFLYEFLDVKNESS